MSRLPVPGSDTNTWGTILNDYLGVAHNTDGTLKTTAVTQGMVYSGATVTVAPQGTATKADYYTDGTADDVEINAAIAAVNTAGGGRVFLKPGTYNISAPLVVSLHHGFTLEGESTTSVTLFAVNGLNGDVITFSPPTTGIWCRIANLKIDHNGANQTAGNAITAEGAIQCLFENLWITHPWGNGLYLHRDGNGGTGHHNRVVKCLFDNGATTNGGDGRAILIQASDENMIMNCDFETNGRHAATEPNHIYDRSGLQHIIGCTFVGGETGVKIEGPYTRVVGCMFDGQSNNHAIRLNGNSNVISSNVISQPGNSGVSATNDGIWIDNVTNNLIANNTFMSDSTGTRSGVNLANGSNNTLVANNMFLTQGSGYGTAPIILGSGNNNVVRDNKGYNPVGPATITVGASPFTYTAGATPETVYISSGTVSSVVKSSFTLFTQSNVSVRLEPNTSVTVTYTVAPTMTKDRH